MKARGVLATAALLVKRRWWALQELYFDATHGVRTRGRVKHDDRVDEDPAYAHAVMYSGVRLAAFRECFAALDIDAREYVFVDIGCGKGRALALASRHPFRRVVGVELAPELAYAAQINVERLRRRWPHRPPIEVVRADAASYSFPPVPLVVFLYNPFDSTIMERVIRHLGSCLAESRQPAFVMYTAPLQRHITDAAPFLEVHRELDQSVVYRSRLVA